MNKDNFWKNKNILITGVAGFVGSNLLEALLKLNQNVTGIDNFSNSSGNNLTSVQASVKENWSNFTFYENPTLLNRLFGRSLLFPSSRYFVYEASRRRFI